MLHDRRWHVTVDRPELTVLRLVDRGELIAQCNISPAPDAKPGNRHPDDEHNVVLAQREDQTWPCVICADMTRWFHRDRIVHLCSQECASIHAELVYLNT